MDQTSKKTALRKIPDDLYILTAQSEDQNISAAMVKWVTQASFTPPLVAVGVKVDSQVHGIIKSSQTFALNILGKGRLDLAFTFFRSAQRKGQWVVDSLFGLALLACQSLKTPGICRVSSDRFDKSWPSLGFCGRGGGRPGQSGVLRSCG